MEAKDSLCKRCRKIMVLSAFCVVLLSCASTAAVKENEAAVTPAYPAGNSYRPFTILSAPLTADEKQLLASADALMGTAPGSKVVVNGKTFTLDCIGTVCAIYYQLYIDLAKDFSKYPGNGVKRLYASLKDQKVLHNDRYPRAGDVVFWDNTWDANEDGNKNNDPLTHAGVVISVDEDGTIHYVHSHIKRGIIVEVMNLKKPDSYYGENGKVINNALALGSGISRPVNPEHWLSGDLCNSFGDVLAVRQYYSVASADNDDAYLPDRARIALGN